MTEQVTVYVRHRTRDNDVLADVLALATPRWATSSRHVHRDSPASRWSHSEFIRWHDEMTPNIVKLTARKGSS